MRSRGQIYTKATQYIHNIEDLGNTLDEMNTFDIGDISQKLVVRSAKKYGIQLLGDLITISVQDIPTTGGRAIKIFNTFFDYWVGSFPSSVRTGQYMAGWAHTNDQVYHGSYLSLLSDINTEKHLVDGFVKALLGHHTYVCKELQYILLLIYYAIGKKLISILKDDPRNKYAGDKLEYSIYVYKFRVAFNI